MQVQHNLELLQQISIDRLDYNPNRPA